VIDFDLKTKYKIEFTNNFNRQFKKIVKQNKDISKFLKIVERLANNDVLELKYRNHNLENNKKYKNCKECHIEPDWLLIYQVQDDKLILLLFATGSHSDLF